MKTDRLLEELGLIYRRKDLDCQKKATISKEKVPVQIVGTDSFSKQSANLINMFFNDN